MELLVEHLELPPGNDLDILMIGISGHGKSATGNSILRRTQFTSLGGNSSITKMYCVGSSKIDGRSIRVIDTPGIDDTDEYSEKRKQDLLINELTKSLTKCPLGYDAIILVFSYCSRFHRSEGKYLEAWMSLIGKDNFMSHGILVTTYGDKFAKEHPDKTIKQWWEEQPDRFRWLYENCGKRCVLFNNETKDYMESRRQLHNLILEIDGLETQGKPFIPNVCQISDADSEKYEADRKLILNISIVDDQLDIILNDLQILASYTDQCKSVLCKIDAEVKRLKEMLMEERNQKIYEDIKHDFTKFEEKFSELQKLAEFPKSHLMATQNLCEMITNIKLGLQTMIENTLYWNSLKEKTVIFFRDVLPSIAGPAVLAVGVGATIVTTSVVAAPAVAATGATVGLFALANNLYRYVLKKKKEK